MMKPILFNTTMVHAILNGRKTMTRRVVKPTKRKGTFIEADFAGRPCEWVYTGIDSKRLVKMCEPQYQVGDVVWVRETWAKIEDFENNFGFEIHHDLKYFFKCDDVGEKHKLIDASIKRWRPSIHMPKEAARIFLKVADVWVERLQDIIASEIEKEGMAPSNVDKSDDFYNGIAREVFAGLWNSTVKKKEITDFGWDANQWVFVVEFERITESEAKNE